MAALLKEARQAVTDDEFFKFPDQVKNAVAKAPEQRSPYEQQMAHRATIITEPSLLLSMPRLKREKKKRYDELRAKLAKFNHSITRKSRLGPGCAISALRRRPRTYWPSATTSIRWKRWSRDS